MYTHNIHDFFEIITFKDNQKLLKELSLLRQEVFCSGKQLRGKIDCIKFLESELTEIEQYKQQTIHSLVYYNPAKKFIVMCD